jgi:uncharacterized damage-inducible protein DinB
VLRAGGNPPPGVQYWEGFPGFAVLKQAARGTGDELLRLAGSAGPDTLVEEREGTMVVRYPLASLLIQAINHATEHRTHVSTVLTQLGLEPPDLTGWGYMEDTGQFQETEEPAS